VDGRIKSAIGIGSLLDDGIGDTIRVSLTEDPVEEIPVARRLVEPYNRLLRELEGHDRIRPAMPAEDCRLPSGLPASVHREGELAVRGRATTGDHPGPMSRSQPAVEGLHRGAGRPATAGERCVSDPLASLELPFDPFSYG